MGTALMVVLIALAIIVALLVVLWVYGTAHRLDRLHVRLDSAWLALEAALARRAVVARAIAAAAPTADQRLATVAAIAERASRPQRESAENALSARLEDVPVGRLSPQLAGELADAQTRVLLARRFHNDAVRDTVALRNRRLVRWLRLGGTAARPLYFEIVERELLVGPPRRPAARVVLFDSEERALLLRGADPDGSFYWITTGGGVEPGEGLASAAIRELTEETGLELDVGALRGPLWWRRAVLEFDGHTIEAEETYFTASVADFEPRSDGFTALEKRTITDFRWCTAADLAELEDAGEQVYPPGLDALLPEALAAVRAGSAGPSPALRRIQ